MRWRAAIDLMEWTFDPLEIKNAYLNIVRLGAIARRYMRDFYGPSTSPLQGGLPTDRLVAEWWLRSARVRRTLGEDGAAKKRWPTLLPIRAIWSESPSRTRLQTGNETRSSVSWLSRCRPRNRLALESAFARGLAITGYERSPQGDGCFLLGPVSGLEDRKQATTTCAATEDSST